MKNHHIIFLALLAAGSFYFLLISLAVPQLAAITAAITALTVIFWVTEAIPIPIASLLPIALFPIFGVLDHKQAASALGSHVILLLLGAFMLSKAIEKSMLHQRFATFMVTTIGTSSSKKLVFGFMLASALLSMWISNTATILIMLPIAMAVLKDINDTHLKIALILGVAYAANLGGIGTLIGTPPNVIFAAIYQETTGQEFGFLQWMMIGVPVVLVTLPIMSLWLTRNLTIKHSFTIIPNRDWQSAEKRTLIVFGLTILAWITRKEPFGGWTQWLNVPNIGDSTIALTAVIIMFLIPNGKGSKLLDWQAASSIPWGMLLLFAGGIAIAKGFSASGLSEILGASLTSLDTLPILLMIFALCLAVTFLTEITSNTATATLLMPILAAVAVATENNPALFMVPAAMCASCAFMLPVATAPNAIAFATGEIQIKQMIKEGFVLSLIASCAIALLSYFLLSV